MGKLGNVSPNASIDESKVQQDHQEAYQQGNASNLSAGAMGSAAAIQAFKAFASGGGAAQQQSGGGSMIQKLIGMAMSEAVKVGLDCGFVLTYSSSTSLAAPPLEPSRTLSTLPAKPCVNGRNER